MVLAVVAILMIFIDQGVKFLTVTNFSVGEVSDLIPGVISLTRMHNTGVAFSFGAGINGKLLAGISFVIVLILVVILATKKIKDRGQRWALIFVVAGAVSNALDRLVSGYVVDMFKFEFMNFGIFNVADICIVCGIIVFAILWIRGDSGSKRSGEKSGKDMIGDVKDENQDHTVDNDHKRPQRPVEGFSKGFDLPVDSVDIGEDDPQDSSFTLNDILREFGEDSDYE